MEYICHQISHILPIFAVVRGRKTVSLYNTAFLLRQLCCVGGTPRRYAQPHLAPPCCDEQKLPEHLRVIEVRNTQLFLRS